MDLKRKELCHCLQRWAAGGSGDCCWLAGHIWPAGLVLQISLSSIGGCEAHQLCPVMAWAGSDSKSCSECMDSVESVMPLLLCRSGCPGRDCLGPGARKGNRVGVLSFPCWKVGDAPLELFSVGSLGLLGQEGDSCSHTGVLAGLAVAGCLLGLSMGISLWVGAVSPHLSCVSVPQEGTLLPSQNHCEGPSYLLEKHLILHRKILKHFSQLTPVQASLALSHLKTLMPERCPVVLVMT